MIFGAPGNPRVGSHGWMPLLKELPIPPAAVANGREIVRAWAADEKLHVALASETWEDPGAWGIFLVDLAKHVANAFAERGADHDDVLARVREVFDAEWTRATSDVEGTSFDA